MNEIKNNNTQKMKVDKSTVDRAIANTMMMQLQKDRVYPKLLYINPENLLQKVIFIIGIFFFAPIFMIYEMNSAQYRDLSLTWFFFSILSLLLIDLLRRLKIFPNNKKKYIILISSISAILILLLILSIMWMISWNVKSFPVLERMFIC